MPPRRQSSKVAHHPAGRTARIIGARSSGLAAERVRAGARSQHSLCQVAVTVALAAASNVRCAGHVPAPLPGSQASTSNALWPARSDMRGIGRTSPLYMRGYAQRPRLPLSGHIRCMSACLGAAEALAAEKGRWM
jgi:hypothetical protein